MASQLMILVLVVIVALGFDFTNGFHDTGNAMATSIATGALRPKIAVALSAILNLVGAFLSVEVALTVTNAVVKIQDDAGKPIASLSEHHGNDLLMIILAGPWVGSCGTSSRGCSGSPPAPPTRCSGA